MPRGRPKGSVNKPKTELTPVLKDTQIRSLKLLDERMGRIMRAFRSLDMPYYDDVCDLDNAISLFKYEFMKELKND